MAERPQPQDPLLLIDFDKQAGTAAKFRFRISVPPRALYWFMSILGAGSTSRSARCHPIDNRFSH